MYAKEFVAAVACAFIPLAISASALAQAQHVGSTGTASPAEKQAKRPFAYLDSKAVWPTNEINVCWDNPALEHREAMELVRTAVHETWEAHTVVRFVNWGGCAPKNTGIRVTIVDRADLGPRTRGLGRQMEMRGTKQESSPGGMLLNFTFQNWSPEFCAEDKNRSTCIRSIAIHEFGHALGLAHEQNREDNLGQCKEPPQGGNGDTVIGPFDHESVMNYCKAIYIPTLELTKWDIAGVEAGYGK